MDSGVDLVALMKAEKAKLKEELKNAKQNSVFVTKEEEITDRTNGKADFDVFVSLQIPLTSAGHRLVDGCDEMLYFKEIISEKDELLLKDAVKSQSERTPWVKLTNRKSIMCGSHHDSKARVTLELPQWLKSVAKQLPFFDADKNPINHVLINAYETSGGIAHHTDGPSYLDTVAILSLGGPVLLSFKERLKTIEIGHKTSTVVHSVVMEPRSLLVFSGSVYSEFLHGVDPSPSSCDIVDHTTRNKEAAGLMEGDVVERAPRISLTLRHFYEE